MSLEMFLGNLVGAAWAQLGSRTGINFNVPCTLLQVDLDLVAFFGVGVAGVRVEDEPDDLGGE